MKNKFHKELIGISLLVFSIFLSCKKDALAPISLIDESDSGGYSEIRIDSLSKSLFSYGISANPGGNKRGFQGCPTIGYHKGVYYAAWISGKKTEEINNYISVATSLDSGKTWKQDMLTIAPLSDSVRHIDPSFWLDKNGNLRLSWTKIDGMWDGFGEVWSIKVRYKSNSIQITTPRKLFFGVMNVKPLQLLPDSSKIIFPVSGWNMGGGWVNGDFYTRTKPEFNGAFLFKSEVSNSTGVLYNPSKYIKLPTTYSRVYDEHMVVDHGNGRWSCMFRTLNNGICTSTSLDSGRTWSKQSEFKLLGPTTASRFFYSRLKSGNILFVLNNSLKREMLTAYLSVDNGLTWPYKLLIDSRLTVSYPDVVISPQGEICLIYDRDRFPLGEINMCKFTEKDIITNNTQNIKRFTVSRLQ